MLYKIICSRKICWLLIGFLGDTKTVPLSQMKKKEVTEVREAVRKQQAVLQKESKESNPIPNPDK